MHLYVHPEGSETHTRIAIRSDPADFFNVMRWTHHPLVVPQSNQKTILALLSLPAAYAILFVWILWCPFSLVLELKNNIVNSYTIYASSTVKIYRISPGRYQGPFKFAPHIVQWPMDPDLEPAPRYIYKARMFPPSNRSIHPSICIRDLVRARKDQPDPCVYPLSR